MRYYYHVSHKSYNEKRFHQCPTRFRTYDEAEKYLDSLPHDEGKISLRKARQ